MASILVLGKRQKNEKKSCNLSDGVRFLGHSICYCINAAIEPSGSEGKTAEQADSAERRVEATEE